MNMPPIDSGNTAFMLVSSALVLLMTRGSGSSTEGSRGKERSQHDHDEPDRDPDRGARVGAARYSLAFAPGDPCSEGSGTRGSRAWARPPRAGTSIPHTVFMAYQLMFAVITPR